eukprot:scaffold255863_cov40-Tisochrysis_lutea.AAC.1
MRSRIAPLREKLLERCDVGGLDGSIGQLWLGPFLAVEHAHVARHSGPRGPPRARGGRLRGGPGPSPSTQ